MSSLLAAKNLQCLIRQLLDEGQSIESAQSILKIHPDKPFHALDIPYSVEDALVACNGYKHFRLDELACIKAGLAQSLLSQGGWAQLVGHAATLAEMWTLYLNLYPKLCDSTPPSWSDNFLGIEYPLCHSHAVELANLMELRIATNINACYALTDNLHTELLESVHFQHTSRLPPTHFEDVLGCKVLFNQPFTGLRFRPGVLDLPLSSYEPELAEACIHLTARTQQVSRSGDKDQPTDFVERVCLLIQTGLVSGVTQSTTAEKLGMSVSTLKRKLSDKGTSYQVLLDRILDSRARQALEQSDQSLDDIARELGFSGAASFTQKFRRSNSITPAQYRRRYRRSLDAKPN